MWLGEQMTEYGIGNGTSLIIFAGIISRLPDGITSLVQNTQVGKNLAGTIGFIAIIVNAYKENETLRRHCAQKFTDRHRR